MSLVLLPLALMYFSISVLFDSWAPVPQWLLSGAGSDAVFLRTSLFTCSCELVTHSSEAKMAPTFKDVLCTTERERIS